MLTLPRILPVEPRRFVAALTLAVFFAACTTQQARPPVELRHFQVDWEHAGAQELEVQGLRIRALLLTPTQWPLESSVKRLLQGDFIGVIDAFDLRFRSSKIPAGILEDLYDRGFVPAYVRVENRSTEARAFQPPAALAVRDRSGQDLPAADPEDLPPTFTRVDVERTLLVAAGVVLVAIAVVADRRGQLNLASANFMIEPSGNVYVGAPARTSGGGVYVNAAVSAPGEAAETEGGLLGGSRADRSLLRAGVLAPGEAREGVILFWHKNATVDWNSARLTAR